MVIDSVFRMGKSYYPQVFLKKSKYKIKEKKITTFITDDIETSSDNDLREKFIKITLYKRHSHPYEWHSDFICEQSITGITDIALKAIKHAGDMSQDYVLNLGMSLFLSTF